MSGITWSKKYEIGHARIDFEHQIFVDLIVRIHDAAKSGEDKDYLQRLLYELRKYAEFHFISEENIMYAIHYPEYEAHKLLHHKLLERYSQKTIEIELEEQTIDDFLTFLKDWFINHTLKEDSKIAAYVQGKQI